MTQMTQLYIDIAELNQDQGINPESLVEKRRGRGSGAGTDNLEDGQEETPMLQKTFQRCFLITSYFPGLQTKGRPRAPLLNPPRRTNSPTRTIFVRRQRM